MNLDDFPVIDSLDDILTNDVPLLDVRAPVEFAQGAFPQSFNLPLMSDDERKAVGICYKENGQEAAIALGAELVKDNVKEERVAAWADFFDTNPEGVLYCFRGGLRSKITQLWIYETTGKIIPRVEGGYKALRRFLIDSIDTSMKQITPIVLSGSTGSGKTRLLHQLNDMVDLEGLANHRGSAFGRNATPQPTAITFENALAITLRKHLKNQKTTLLFEDESRNIGSVHLPTTFFDHLKAAQIILLKMDDATRIQTSLQEYVIDMENDWEKYGNGFDDFADYLQSSLDRVKKRFGGERYKAASQVLQEALQLHKENNDRSGYKKLIQSVLHEYYDPMYDYQLSQKEERIIFSGNKEEVLEYLADQGIA